ncbi:putative enzyme related to lactoylglutathione lyase [Nocardioides daedukensis]|uniref:Putative enzyme related to lactoylglutathione lyase n=1 Tax=Nocardioides daedukensis TaxID=634462 RepID=A0A7Y9S393_9ACTN|nr:VOC family protein [Nocardioides daedukensis]NYG59303.1 putative enzyme related to lactoylglutathione lyase [Nocardioides daedukensis]
MGTRIANIVINAVDARLVADFWAKVLDWEHLDEEHGIICIGPAGGALPGIDVAPWGRAKTTTNRLHLDLRADGTTKDEELERLLALGARRVDVGQGPDVSWDVLADPEGNEFCLLSGTVQELQQRQ